jgi:hypothetical protein
MELSVFLRNGEHPSSKIWYTSSIRPIYVKLFKGDHNFYVVIEENLLHHAERH